MVVIVLTSLVRIQQHLGTMQSELETAKQAAALMKAQATELAKRIAGLNSELEEANAQRDELQTKLDQATELAKRAASLNSELEKTNAQRDELQTKLDQATSEIKSAQSRLEDKQSHLLGVSATY